MRAAQAGSAEAFEGLFALHWPRAYRAAWLVVHDAAAAEDIAQEAFIAALQRARPLRPPAAVRAVADTGSSSTARSTMPARGGCTPCRREGIAATAPAPADGWSDEVVRALAQLPVDQRAVVVMRHALGYTPGEIARALGLPRGTVNSRLRRALDRLGEAAR